MEYILMPKTMAKPLKFYFLGLFMAVILMFVRLVWCFSLTGCVFEVLQVTLTRALTGWVKQTSLSNLGGPHLIHWEPNRIKSLTLPQVEFPLLAWLPTSWDIGFLLCLWTKTTTLTFLGLQLANSPWRSWDMSASIMYAHFLIASLSLFLSLSLSLSLSLYWSV